MSEAMSTCLSTLTRGELSDDKEHLTAQHHLCDHDSDVDYPDDDCDVEVNERQSFIRRFVHSTHCSICLYLSVSLLLVGSLVALTVIIVQVLLPYNRVQGFLSATCFPSKVRVEPGQTCPCGTGCTARYSCIMVQVTYHDQTGVWTNATIYDDETTINKKCSFYPSCQGSPAHIAHEVNVFKKRYAVVGLPYTCWSNPSNHKQAIRIKRFHLYHIVNGLLWTVLILLVSIMALVAVVKKRRICNSH